MHDDIRIISMRQIHLEIMFLNNLALSAKHVTVTIEPDSIKKVCYTSFDLNQYSIEL